MKFFPFILVLGTVATAGTPMEQDEIRWKNPERGGPVKVRVISSDGANLTVEKTLAAGTARRVIPQTELTSVDFAEHVSDQKIPPGGGAEKLREHWKSRAGCIALPSNAAETGLALARALEESGVFDEAETILKTIQRDDAEERNRTLAAKRLEALALRRAIRTGDAAAAEKTAWAITDANANADAMLAATAFLADRCFAELKSIETEHPRWKEDPEMEPARNRMYHLALDFALYPALFHSLRAGEAAQGLAKAAALHRHCGDAGMETAVLEDLAALYPESKETAEAAPLLARLRAERKPPSETETAKPPSENHPAENSPAPPEPKSYNLFRD